MNLCQSILLITVIKIVLKITMNKKKSERGAVMIIESAFVFPLVFLVLFLSLFPYWH